jgi:hypothetical protein
MSHLGREIEKLSVEYSPARLLCNERMNIKSAIKTAFEERNWVNPK